MDTQDDLLCNKAVAALEATRAARPCDNFESVSLRPDGIVDKVGSGSSKGGGGGLADEGKVKSDEKKPQAQGSPK